MLRIRLGFSSVKSFTKQDDRDISSFLFFFKTI